MGGHPANPEIREVSPEGIDSVNIMCTMPDSDPRAVMEESARVHRHVASIGVRTLAVFDEGKPVGRLEIMPIEAAPLALSGDGLWVIRCLWVLEKSQGRGMGRALMERAIEIASGSKGIAVVTYNNWMPVPFFEKFGFELVDRKGSASLLLLKMSPHATASFVPPRNAVPISPDRSKGDLVAVEAVFTGRCPWLMQSWRRWLRAARDMSDRVVTSERFIFTRDDAMHYGDENIYIDGIPLDDSPLNLEAFRKAVAARLLEKGLG
ncbi:MAG: GNAT family N-acetyltransferase [Firmicutes bacterium]|nr:GNAT family N-acetyltransferase [Candidatus Fermentithermobacillaceae bacterium]